MFHHNNIEMLLFTFFLTLPWIYGKTILGKDPALEVLVKSVSLPKGA